MRVIIMLNKSRVYSLNDRLNLQKNSIISEDMMLGDKVKIKGYGISEGEGISLEKIFHPVLLYIVDVIKKRDLQGAHPTDLFYKLITTSYERRIILRLLLQRQRLQYGHLHGLRT